MLGIQFLAAIRDQYSRLDKVGYRVRTLYKFRSKPYVSGFLRQLLHQLGMQ